MYCILQYYVSYSPVSVSKVSQTKELGAREARAGRVRGRYSRGFRYLDASRLVKPPTDCCDRAQNTPAEASFELDLDRVKPVCARRLRRRTAWMGRAWRL